MVYLADWNLEFSADWEKYGAFTQGVFGEGIDGFGGGGDGYEGR